MKRKNEKFSKRSKLQVTQYIFPSGNSFILKDRHWETEDENANRTGRICPHCQRRIS